MLHIKILTVILDNGNSLVIPSTIILFNFSRMNYKIYGKKHTGKDIQKIQE